VEHARKKEASLTLSPYVTPFFVTKTDVFGILHKVSLPQQAESVNRMQGNDTFAVAVFSRLKEYFQIIHAAYFLPPALYVYFSSQQGEYYNCTPQIFLKFSGQQDSGTERYPSPKLAAEIHFYCLKNSVQF